MAGLIGVFGGTFDPPHLGHLILAEGARSAFDLERVVWVVTGSPPHKPSRPITPVAIRVAMVDAAIQGNEAFEVSRADVDRPPPHYAVGTLEWLASRHAGANFVYLVGEDSLRDLPTWHNPQQLLAACAMLGVMRRPGVQYDLGLLQASLPGLMEKLRFYEAPLIGISGQEIRRRVRQGISYRYLVPDSVADIIEREGLYRWDS